VKDEREALLGTAQATVEKGKGGKKKKTVKEVGADIRANIAGNRKPGDTGHIEKSPPVLLELYCNMTELVRLRSELIQAASETAVLQKIYLD
jgi:hypothetical protein